MEPRIVEFRCDAYDPLLTDHLVLNGLIYGLSTTLTDATGMVLGDKLWEEVGRHIHHYLGLHGDTPPLRKDPAAQLEAVFEYYVDVGMAKRVRIEWSDARHCRIEEEGLFGSRAFHASCDEMKGGLALLPCPLLGLMMAMLAKNGYTFSVADAEYDCDADIWVADVALEDKFERLQALSDQLSSSI